MIASKIDHNYIQGVGLLSEKRLLTLLDLSKVFDLKEFEQIVKAQNV